MLPAQLEAIGALLSTPTGGASALCKGAHALLGGYPLWGVLVEDVGAPACAREQLINGDIDLAICNSFMWGGMMLAGSAAMRTRCVWQRDRAAISCG